MKIERIRTFNDQQRRAIAIREIDKGVNPRTALKIARVKFAELEEARAHMPPPPMLDH